MHDTTELRNVLTAMDNDGRFQIVGLEVLIGKVLALANHQMEDFHEYAQGGKTLLTIDYQLTLGNTITTVGHSHRLFLQNNGTEKVATVAIEC